MLCLGPGGTKGGVLSKWAGHGFFAFLKGILKSYSTRSAVLYFGYTKLRGAEGAGFVKIGGANEFFAFSKDLPKSRNKKKGSLKQYKNIKKRWLRPL